MLVALNEHECADTSFRTIVITDEYSFYAPNAFSPNGDGINDCFRMCGSGIDSENYSMIIYDRWGQAVFTSNFFDEDIDCKDCGQGSWDGTNNTLNKEREYLPNGIYHWSAVFKDYHGTTHKQQGTVQLIR